MNKIKLEFPSGSLKTTARVAVLLPKRRPSPFDGGEDAGLFPTLYLLHGAMEDEEGWLHYTDISRLTDELGLATVMPYGGNSFYLDDPEEGTGYHTFVTDELPEYLTGILPLSHKREDTFIGGYSMGGYGAVYAALTRPERYAAAFSLSGCLDIAAASGFIRACGGALPHFLRDTRALRGSEWDLGSLAEARHTERAPRLILACGEQDYFLPASKNFYKIASDAGLAVELSVSPGGHDWDYWSFVLPGCIRRLMSGRE